MKIIKITWLLLLSSSVMTGEDSCHQSSTIQDHEKKNRLFSSNAQIDEDATRNQVKTIFDIYKLFDKSTVKKAHTEWISKNRSFERPSKIINDEKITFTTFIADKDILPIEDLGDIVCKFKHNLKMTFPIATEVFYTKGEIEFLRSENSSSCKVSFNASFNQIGTVVYGLAITPESRDITNKSKKIDFTNYRWDILKFEVENLESEACQQYTDENQLQIETLQAMTMIVEERLKAGVESVFQSQYTKCLYPQFGQKVGPRSHFKLDLNTNGFLWESEYHELIITGLDEFQSSEVSYDGFSDDIHYSLYAHNIKILWIIRSGDTRRFNFNTNSIRIGAVMDRCMDYTDINLRNIAEMGNDEHIEWTRIRYPFTNKMGMRPKNDGSTEMLIEIPTMLEDYNENNVVPEVREEISKLILMGIEQTFQKIRYDGTAEFTDTISRILKSFDGNKFKNLFNDLKNKNPKSSFTFTTLFFRIEMEAYSHLENITCMTDNYDQIQKIGVIRYKDIKGEGDYIGYIKSEGIHIAVRGSTYVHLKEVNFNIFLQRYQYQFPNLNRTNGISVKIDDNFVTNTTITLDYTLRREDGNNVRRHGRILVGQKILKAFTELFNDTVREVVNSAFRPLIEICTSEDLLNTFNKSNVDYLDNWRPYFAFIRSHWVNSRDPSVDVVIKGIWSIKNINARYVNENIIIDGLRIKNITGSIKLWDEPLKKSIILDYTANHLLLKFNHAKTNVTVKVPGNLKLSNTTHDLTNNSYTSEVTKKFETTVASFMQQSIYGGLISYAKYQTLINETIKKAERNETLSTYNATSEFVNNFAETLKNVTVADFFRYEVPRKTITDDLKVENYYTSNRIFRHNDAVIIFKRPIITEEICDNFDYSQNDRNFHEKINLYGNLTIFLEKSKEVLGRIPFTRNKHRVMNISVNGNKNSNESMEFNIDNEAMKIDKRLETLDENMRKIITKIATDYLQPYKNQKELSLPPNICRRRYGSLKPSENHFYSITNTIEDASQNLLIHYNIKLFGLYNFKSLRLIHEGNNNGITFELSATNLTAQITWSYYMENSRPKIFEKIKLQIDQILLAGIIDNFENGQLYFNNRSRLDFSDSNDSISTKSKKTLESIIIKSIKNSVKEKYLKG